MLEVLGEHLYIKIEEMPELFRMELDVAKITGVLLELGEQQVRLLKAQVFCWVAKTTSVLLTVKSKR